MHAMHEILNQNALDVVATTDEERFALGVLRLRRQLFAWYSEYAARSPIEELTQLTNLTTKMLGSKASPKLKVKGAEAWGMLLFVVEKLVPQYAHRVPHSDRWLAAGVALVQHMRVMKAEGRVSPRNPGPLFGI